MSIDTRLKQLVNSGYSEAYIESVLWASYSRNDSIKQISAMVTAAKPEAQLS